MKLSRFKHYGLAVLMGASLFAAQAATAQTASCKYIVSNSWGAGGTASIEITNTSTSAINGWNVSWAYVNNRISSSWNATLSGSNPYSASNLSWNGSIQPGQKVSFGMQVETNGAIETPVVTGAICGGGGVSSAPASSTAPSSTALSSPALSSKAPSSTPKSSIAPSSTPKSSVAPSSVAQSSSPAVCTTGAKQCNWYGTLYPACTSTQSGWGWENNKSCIAVSTCMTQPAPYGLVGGAACTASSTKSSTAPSSIAPSSAAPSSVPKSSVAPSSIAKSSSSAPSTGGVDSVALTKLMGKGWNIGNSLDAIGGETNWGNPKVSQNLINAVKAAGFNSIRLPVAWSRFSDASNFVIDTAWMNRVDEVVNYALNADMYIVMNIHWDGGWMQPTAAQQTYVNNRLRIMWTQIATRFRDYDDRVLFAGTNEVMVDGDYGTPTAEYYNAQNSFNQTFVTTVRATGGKNATRHLVVQGFNTNIDHTVNFAKLPIDSASKRLMMEVHYYDPYNFTLNTSSNITQWGKNATNPSATETWANESYTDAQFQKMKSKYVDQGVGVILGEYGVVSRANVSDNEIYRVYWNQYITGSAVQHGMVPMYWDNGYGGDGGMALFDRATGNQLYPNLIQAIVNAK